MATTTVQPGTVTWCRRLPDLFDLPVDDTLDVVTPDAVPQAIQAVTCCTACPQLGTCRRYAAAVAPPAHPCVLAGQIYDTGPRPQDRRASTCQPYPRLGAWARMVGERAAAVRAQLEYEAARPRFERVCDYCEGTFTTLAPDARYCGGHCRNTASRNRRRQNRPRYQRRCIRCQTKFESVNHQRKQCDKCRATPTRRALSNDPARGDEREQPTPRAA